MNKIAVLGLGKVGTLVGLLLNELFNVVGYDMSKPHYKIQYPFPCHIADISKTKTIREVVEHVDVVVSALPYYLNLRIATIAHQKGIHYFDLTEDISTMHQIKSLGKNASSVLAPQCGLAPGLIGIIGGYLASKFDKLRDIELRVGALQVILTDNSLIHLRGLLLGF